MSSTWGEVKGGPLIAGYCIPIRHQKQHHENACWATCLAMIFQWSDVSVPKEKIFTEAKDILQDYDYGQVATLAEANKVAKKLSDGKISFEQIDIDVVRKKDSFYWIAYINLFKPILFSMDNHCRILMGYNGSGQLLIMDPAKDSKDEPEPIGIRVFSEKAKDVWVMK